MEVRDCPQCGSSDIEKSSYSAEYMSSTTWSCGDCEWSYKSGSGMGTGSGNSGTHPRKLSGGDQQTLSETGEYCPNCEVVMAGDHACTPAAVLAASEEDNLTQRVVIEALDEWHVNPRRVLTEAVDDGDVDLTPTFYRVIPTSDHPAMYDEILSEVNEILGEQDDDVSQGHVSIGVLTRRLAADNDTEETFINRCLQQMKRERLLDYGWDGVAPRDG